MATKGSNGGNGEGEGEGEGGALWVFGRGDDSTVEALRNPEREPTAHNHVRAINYLHSRGKLPQGAGQLHNIIVQHDDWCALPARRGACNCQPTIKVDGVRMRVPAWVYASRR